MSSSEQHTPSSSTGLPVPPEGVGAADLKTDSTDPQELRDLLERARERLAFYESFDRIIGENIRRSGELMVETVALREQAQALAAQSAKERAEFEATRQADRERYRDLVAGALAEVETARPVIDGMIARLQEVLDTLEDDASDQDATADSASVSLTSALVEPWQTDPRPDEEAPSPDEAARKADAETEADPPAVDATEPTTAEDAPVPANTVEPDVPSEPTVRNLTVLAHNVPNAKVAVALQKMLRGLDVVTSVDTREFANGELRLAVIATDALPQDALEAWVAEHGGKAFHASPAVLEITLTTAAKS